MSQLISCPKCQRSYPPTTLFCAEDGTSLSSALSDPLLVIGFKIGEYLLEKKIGAGGMGEVWSARHPQIGKQVAIKLLNEKMISNRRAISRFMQEARAVNEIQHRNIVDIFAFGELADGRPYFVMEFLKGKSLADYLSEKGPLPMSEILSIFEQVCSALQASHERNIIHRDLKPDNIFLIFESATRSREASLLVKILDFGIAKLDTPEGEGLTKSGATMGTPAYMSPEQCEGAKTAEQTSDIYALGIILYELLTGRTPFFEPGDGIGMIISKHMFMPAVAPSAKVSGRSIPAALDALVLRALAKKPKERFVSCTALFEVLLSATSSLANETREQIKGARPLYESKSQDEGSLERIVVEGISNKAMTQTAPLKVASLSHTEDYYSSSQEGKLEEFRPKRSRGWLMVLMAFGFGSLVAVIVVVFNSLQEGPDIEKVIPREDPLKGVTLDKAVIEPASASTLSTKPNQPQTIPVEATTQTTKTPEKIIEVSETKPPKKPNTSNKPKNSDKPKTKLILPP
jgi:eukaryotic-like serine/threonine-protein kinase